MSWMPAAKASSDGAREGVRRDNQVETAAGEVGGDDGWLRMARRDCCEAGRRAGSMGSVSRVVGGTDADVGVGWEGV
jgi:hypothetical protein